MQRGSVQQRLQRHKSDKQTKKQIVKKTTNVLIPGQKAPHPQEAAGLRPRVPQPEWKSKTSSSRRAQSGRRKHQRGRKAERWEAKVGPSTQLRPAGVQERAERWEAKVWPSTQLEPAGVQDQFWT